MMNRAERARVITILRAAVAILDSHDESETCDDLAYDLRQIIVRIDDLPNFRDPSGDDGPTFERAAERQTMDQYDEPLVDD